jgi:hypothetical protein
MKYSKIIQEIIDAKKKENNSKKNKIKTDNLTTDDLKFESKKIKKENKNAIMG